LLGRDNPASARPSGFPMFGRLRALSLRCHLFHHLSK
jgi:hypothetical protein